ncbi:hypothetical protein D3C81_2105560 [compost metagenome]
MKLSGSGVWREQLILSSSSGSEPGAAGVVTGGLKMSRMAIPSPTNGIRYGTAAMAMEPTFSRMEGSS